MNARYIFVGILSLLVALIAGIFVIQPGRYPKKAVADSTTQQYQNYLSNWTSLDKAAFADCMMTYTEDSTVTNDEAQTCVNQVTK